MERIDHGVVKLDHLELVARQSYKVMNRASAGETNSSHEYGLGSSHSRYLRLVVVFPQSHPSSPPWRRHSLGSAVPSRDGMLSVRDATVYKDISDSCWLLTEDGRMSKGKVLKEA